MKTVLFGLIFFVFFTANSLEVPNGILNLKWGDSKALTESKLKSIGMTAYSKDDNQMIFTGGFFMDMEVYMLFAEFSANKLYGCKIWIRVNKYCSYELGDYDRTRGKTLTETLREVFTLKYGNPTKSKSDSQIIYVWYFDNKKPLAKNQETNIARYFVTLYYFGRNEIIIEYCDKYRNKNRNMFSD